MKNKLFRITTVPISLDKLLEGQLNFMSNYYQVTAVSSNKNELIKIGNRENVATIEVNMSRKITPFKDFLSIIKLFLILNKQKPLIVHSHTPKAGMVAMFASYLAKTPIRLHTVAGLPLMEAKGVKFKVLKIIEKLTYLCASKVYTNSFGLLDYIVEEKMCSLNKISVIANGSTNGIDTNYFNVKNFEESELNELKKQLKISDTDFVFIFVGRLVKDKGINELIEAFSKLKIQNTKLLLVGSFEEKLDPLSSNTIAEINKNPHIISVGFKKDVRPYFAISNVLVFPSYREGFPNVVMQAGAMGLPSIVTNINGCNEIIQEKYNGIIIPKKNTSAIFEAMNQLLVDEKLYQKTKQNSREVIVERYEQKVVWQAILKEYKKLEKSV